MKTIKITQRNGDTHNILVDARDYSNVIQYKWHVTSPAKGTRYCMRQEKYNGRLRNIPIQNQILNFDRTDPNNKHKVIDHINHNGFDNRRVNLRIVTISENNRNTRRLPASSGYKGIYPWRNKQGEIKKWFARIELPNGRAQHVGLYPTIEEAVSMQELAYRGEIKLEGKIY